MRRIVTGNKDGKSVIIDDAEIPSEPMAGGLFGVDIATLWAGRTSVTIPVDESDLKKPLPRGFPKLGEMTVSINRLLPDKEVFRKAKEQGLDLGGTWRQAFQDDYGMHTTDTIDYDIVLSGEMWLELDDGVEAHLKPGDCVVQNGTRHAWRNRGSEPCVVVVVVFGAKRR